MFALEITKEFAKFQLLSILSEMGVSGAANYHSGVEASWTN